MPVFQQEFVLLFHRMPEEDDRQDHFDLMVQLPGQPDSLATWAVAVTVDLKSDSDFQVSAIRLDDHRAEYLEYEGPISKDRGSVTRVESGRASWDSVVDGSFQLRLESGETWEVIESGQRQARDDPSVVLRFHRQSEP
ncbi:MAG: hypothetical protein AAF456_23275 [Planctomycetota bacterium]